MLLNKNLKPSETYTFLSMYARYLYHEKTLRKKEIVKELNAFMEENYPRYNPVDWSARLEKYASKAGKYPLCKCEGIWITENEVGAIEEIHDKVLERLAFTLLCLAKFRNFRNPDNHNWVNYGNGEIYSMACINTTAFEKDLKLNKLRELGLIEYAKKVSNLNIQVLYLCNESKHKLFISDFRKLGYEWKLYKGENYIRCANCAILAKRKNNNQRYCKDCSEKVRNERQKAMMRGRRYGLTDCTEKDVREISRLQNAGKPYLRGFQDLQLTN